VADLAEKPEMIYRLFRTKQRNAQCYFEVVLFIDGEWQIVLLDDFFVVHKSQGHKSDFVFSIPNGFLIWVQILEKDWAIVNGVTRMSFQDFQRTRFWLSLVFPVKDFSTGLKIKTTRKKFSKSYWSQIGKVIYGLIFECEGS
jgi:hypothetical protein